MLQTFPSAWASDRLRVAAAFIDNSVAILPPVSPKNDLFGRGVDVRLDFHQKVMKRFGGMFRAAKAGVNPTQAKLQFF